MTEKPTPEETQQIIEALAAGRKIDAIKIYRNATGVGLKESKDFIDALLPQLMEEDPEKFRTAAQGQGPGCAAVLAFLLVLAVGVGVFLAVRQ